MNKERIGMRGISKLVAVSTLAALTAFAAPEPGFAQQNGAPVPMVPPVADGELVVTLLGTGTPAAEPNRAGYANLVQAGDTILLFDAGRNAVTRMNQLGMSVGALDGVFITHFHSDHVNGLADVFMTGYLSGPIGRRTTKLPLYGPEGVQELADGMRMAHMGDIRVRIENENIASEGSEFEVHTVEPGVIYDQNGVKVTMFDVTHGEHVHPAVGYKVEYMGKSVLFSGDTNYNQNVVDHGKDVDLLVHEVGAVPDAIAQIPFVKAIMSLHTPPDQVGTIFSETKPQMAVLSHVVRLETPNAPRVSMSEIVTDVRETYEGPLVVAEDLMQFRITENGIALLLANQ